jgi:hypothetical protein
VISERNTLFDGVIDSMSHRLALTTRHRSAVIRVVVVRRGEGIGLESALEQAQTCFLYRVQLCLTTEIEKFANGDWQSRSKLAFHCRKSTIHLSRLSSL